MVVCRFSRRSFRRKASLQNGHNQSHEGGEDDPYPEETPDARVEPSSGGFHVNSAEDIVVIEEEHAEDRDDRKGDYVSAGHAPVIFDTEIELKRKNILPCGGLFISFFFGGSCDIIGESGEGIVGREDDHSENYIEANGNGNRGDDLAEFLSHRVSEISLNLFIKKNVITLPSSSILLVM